ncbi:MAG: Asp-tRNA(Asn)/Glu-tRNA(Gln) amidotransferase subunit GatB [Candidatus Omnitrophica bacterium]|nr:Asp-tRNA(Asn)/Glu-tRNA(Gln) amidotransferase subunit GatB [Candidatus Omnitrophota bacterium]
MTTQTEKKFETVIGLEVHLQFKTRTKIFCGCANEFGNQPNTQTCPICLGLPGTLPVFNRTALEYAIKVALALNAKVSSTIKFDRKNYYYPDLPKGYQISQFDKPIARDGFIMIPTASSEKRIGIHRAHLEEDAGKIIHDSDIKASLVDYNRTGTPLMEIVTEPDLRSPQEAYDYLTTLKLILKYLDVSDCDMEKGSLRCDANISVREVGETILRTKTELKNMNSFKAVKIALEFEEARHRAVYLAGETITQETRLWNEIKQMTVTMRSKEQAHDYRYFPEPDLVPFIVSTEQIDEIRQTLPEFPEAKLNRLKNQYGLNDYDANVLVQEKAIANFFEDCCKIYQEPKKICNWLTGAIAAEINSRNNDIVQLKISPQNLTALIAKVENGVVSNLVAKDILTMMIDSGQSADIIIAEKGLAQVSDDSALEKVIDEILAANPGVVAQIKEGKDSAKGFLVGQAMKKTQGKANPKKLGEMITRRLLNA